MTGFIVVVFGAVLIITGIAAGGHVESWEMIVSSLSCVVLAFLLWRRQ